MIKKIKRILGRSKLIKETYKKIEFLSSLLYSDLFDFAKISLFIKTYPYTMVGYQRLSNVYELSNLIEKNKTAGAFVECGVWKGGCAAVMAYVAQKFGSGRKTWLLDSFEGLPEPTAEDGKIAKDYAMNKVEGNLKTINKCVGTIKDAEDILFKILKLDKKNIEISKGWFQDTLPKDKEKMGKIALLRLDGDWYESTKCCLENLYENVIIGGYIVLDDYGHWEGARRALDEFFAEKKIKPDLIKIDYTGIYFIKP